MSKKKLSKHIVHCHFDGEPSDELIDSLNKMADVAFNNLGKGINNGDTEKRESKLNCNHRFSKWEGSRYICTKCGRPDPPR